MKYTHTIKALYMVQVTSLNSKIPKASVGDIATVVALQFEFEKVVALELECADSVGKTKWKGSYSLESVKRIPAPE